MFFKKIKKKQNNRPRIDTSIEGFRKIGISLTDEQYRDLTSICWQSWSEGKDLDVLTVLLVLKTMGLIPIDYPDESVYSDLDNEYRRKFGCVVNRSSTE